MCKSLLFILKGKREFLKKKFGFLLDDKGQNFIPECWKCLTSIMLTCPGSFIMQPGE